VARIIKLKNAAMAILFVQRPKLVSGRAMELTVVAQPIKKSRAQDTVVLAERIARKNAGDV